MDSFVTLFMFLLYCFTVIRGEIRCYCTEASCISKGYMCLSNIGRCYSSVTLEGDVTHPIHGCVDTLRSATDKAYCDKNIDRLRTSNSDNGFPMLLCCKDDMCNYRDNLDISIVFAKSNESEDRGMKESNVPSSNTVFYPGSTVQEKNPEKDLWFKAAVIAVPIAGGFILIFLVLLAIKMLKSDSKHHRRLVHIRNERSVAKAKLYVSSHFNRKSEKKFPYLFCDKQLSKKGLSRTIDKEGKLYEAICDKNTHVANIRTTTPPSVIVSVGQNSKCEPVAIV